MSSAPAFPQAHPRLSVLSTSSLASSSAEHISTPTSRFSLPTVTSKPSGSKISIYDRPLKKAPTSEVSSSAFAFLFSEIIQYTQKRVDGVADLERRLNTLGYRVGVRVMELLAWRVEGSSKAPKRETRFLPALQMIHGQVWKAVFGKTADAIEKSVENDDEYMIIDNDPPVTRYISVPRDFSSLSCSALTSGIVEAILDGLGFPARVTAHNVATDAHPQRTIILIKLEKSVIEREEALR